MLSELSDEKVIINVIVIITTSRTATIIGR